MIIFRQVMEMMSGEEVFHFLSHPKEANSVTLFCLSAWLSPKLVTGNKLLEIMVQGGATPTLSEARRKIKEGAVKWNGTKVIDFNMEVEFFKKGWGVIQIGKKNHTMVVNNSELCVERA